MAANSATGKGLKPCLYVVVNKIHKKVLYRGFKVFLSLFSSFMVIAVPRKTCDVYCLTATWHEGDRCLAPDPRDGTLRETTIRRLTSTPNADDTVAWVVFSKDGQKEEEEAVPASKLVRPDLSHFNQEKPVFPSSISDQRQHVPLELSGVKGDRVPYTINRYLRDYQREGIKFIYNNYVRSRGCILGDDMGLGKTVQVQCKSYCQFCFIQKLSIFPHFLPLFFVDVI